jgi:hypothetical protein
LRIGQKIILIGQKQLLQFHSRTVGLYMELANRGQNLLFILDTDFLDPSGNVEGNAKEGIALTTHKIAQKAGDLVSQGFH